ncbi:MAG TPA: hypothetical protein VGP53_00385 [Acidimicrobiales bacterium]|nr:hypothetical protein [Acidimicrobiales bacterium]
MSALAACGADSPGTESGAGPTSTAVTSTTTGYTPVSDVVSHAAIGDDFAAIKRQLANAKETKPVDWAAVKTTFSAGGASKKSDGGTRTLAGLVKAPDVVAYITTAIDGGDGSDAVRAQRVEKGITALLYLKVLDEIEAAKTKVAEAKTDPNEGAPHNVDEAWAFYTANGNGVQSTAQKRGDDFKKPVDQTVLAALTATQAAARSGDGQAFATAQRSVRSTLNQTFYLATYKYLDTGGDPTKRAEGESFYLAIAPIVKKAVAPADTALTAAFSTGDAKAGRAALNDPAVVTALELDTSQIITT